MILRSSKDTRDTENCELRAASAALKRGTRTTHIFSSLATATNTATKQQQQEQKQRQRAMNKSEELTKSAALC